MSPGARRQLGEILVEQGLAQPQDIQRALDLQKAGDARPLGQIVLAITEIGSEDVAKALAVQFEMEYVDLDREEIDPNAVRVIDRDFAWENILLPLRYEGGFLKVAVFDPVYLDPLQHIHQTTGLDVRPVIATIESLDRALERCFTGSPIRKSPLRPAPLFERKDDVRRLIGLFLKDFSSADGRIMKISRMALETLLNFPFGSVRHLLDTMEAACKASPHDVIRLEHLPAEVRASRGDQAADPPAGASERAQ